MTHSKAGSKRPNPGRVSVQQNYSVRVRVRRALTIARLEEAIHAVAVRAPEPARIPLLPDLTATLSGMRTELFSLQALEGQALRNEMALRVCGAGLAQVTAASEATGRIHALINPLQRRIQAARIL